MLTNPRRYKFRTHQCVSPFPPVNSFLMRLEGKEGRKGKNDISNFYI